MAPWNGPNDSYKLFRGKEASIGPTVVRVELESGHHHTWLSPHARVHDWSAVDGSWMDGCLRLTFTCQLISLRYVINYPIVYSISNVVISVLYR